MRDNGLIYLTGFMGCGKSTAGPILANVLGYEFQDMDLEIEKEEGCSVSELFEQAGEQAFRRLEERKIRETTRLQGYVVALGGGAVVYGDNLSIIRKHGTLVYLRISSELLARRLTRSGTRPLLRDDSGKMLDEATLRNRIAAMMEIRAPYYEKAHITVDVGEARIGETIDSIIEGLKSVHGMR